MMQIPILIEPVAGNGYRARGCEPFGLTADGATREEALHKLEEQLRARLKTGAQIVSLEIAEQDNPWRQFAGMFEGDPLFDEWQAAIAENRRKADEDPDVL
jgi:predicted RNase H-like HicB family nuclease